MRQAAINAVGEVEMSNASHASRRLLFATVALNVGGAVLISALQVWSASAALPAEYVGRPLLAAVLTAPLLLGKPWGRWPALVVGAATATWLVLAAAGAAILPPAGRIAVGLAAAAVIAGALLPWHPAARVAPRPRTAAPGPSAPAA
jgi:hypothetical protein